MLLEHEPAWARFKDAVAAFVNEAPVNDSPFARLSPRERAVLECMTRGASNVEIAARLGISEKTVRNHASALFGKLGVASRAQAIVLARDLGFRA